MCWKGYCASGAWIVAVTSGFAGAADSQWVKVGQSGRLVHTMDDRGDRILDFSTVGYKGGAVPLPNYSSVVTPDRIIHVAPIAGDNLAHIQAAINQVGNFALNANGFRGVVQLGPGSYDVSATLLVNKSGVILRGVGDGADEAANTILRSTNTSPSTAQVDLIDVHTPRSRPLRLTQRTITDKVVPAGATSFTVDSVDQWEVGYNIAITRPGSDAWISEIGMDKLTPPPRIVPWAAGNFNQTYDRTITHIDRARKRVFLDAPLANAIEKRHAAGTARWYGTNRLENIGIENIRGDGQKTPTVPWDDAHAYSFVHIENAANVWVRNVTGEHLSHATVRAGTQSHAVTVDDAVSVDPISPVDGGFRYPFLLSGQLGLMKNLASDQGRHDFVNNSPSRGPNVFLDGVATNSTDDTGPHQRWSTGTLYDNITTNHEINVQNRLDSGSGHGWSGANMVVWNSTAHTFYVQNPPGAQNWLIGATGTVMPGISDYESSPPRPAYYDANNTGGPVTLGGETSLYRAQLNQRLARPQEVMREYWVGDYDGFENLATDGDDVAVDPAWAAQAVALGGAPLVGMDKTAEVDRGVAMTLAYDVPADQRIVYALLTFATRSTGDGSADDRVWLDGVGSVAFGDLGAGMSFTESKDADGDGTIDTVLVTDVRTLELFSANAGDALTFLQDGKLNLLVGDDTAVDWVNVQLTFAPVPEPTAAGALLLGAFPALLLRRRRR